jgi:hypothetical protein
MKFKLALLSMLAISLFAIDISADQAAYITRAEADKAAAFLKDKKQIRHSCAPCDDKGDRVEDIAAVKAVKVDYQNYWEVQINGKGIDLAYVYFRTKSGKWKNLAKELDIKVHDVPKTLAND